MTSATKTELGQLIDCSEDEFKQYCVDKDLGYIQSFHNLMVQTYNEVQKIKDDLVEDMCKRPKSKRTQEEKSILEGLYSKLLRIEQRVYILREIISNRTKSLKVPNNGT